MFTVLRLLRVSILPAAAVFLAAGCGGDDEEAGPETATQLCDRVATAECNKLYSCTTESIRAQFGLTGPPANCIVGLADNQLMCKSATDQKVCAGANPYSREQAEKCIAEANAATCTQVIANTTNIVAYAPSCAQCVPTFM